jgi:hypothetical protein
MQVATKTRGRPKGSKNKRKMLSADLIAHQCDSASHNPVQFLIEVADGTDHTYEWTKDDRFKANAKLVDLIHGNKKMLEDIDDDINGQYEIVFLQGDEGFTLPGATSTESLEGIHGPVPLQRIGMSQEDGEDGLRYQQTDT